MMFPILLGVLLVTPSIYCQNVTGPTTPASPSSNDVNSTLSASAAKAVNATSANATATNTTSASPPFSTKSAIVAIAHLSSPFGIAGSIQFTLEPGSNAVQVKVDVAGLKDFNSSAQYPYHIHTNFVSSNGNCSSTLGHLNPTHVPESTPCNSTVPQACEVGDLAGRNGKLPGNQTTVNITYSDTFLKFWPQDYSLLGRSVVVHAPNSSRIACGNITSAVDGTADAQGQPTNRSSSYVTQYPQPPSTNASGAQGGASTNGASNLRSTGGRYALTVAILGLGAVVSTAHM